MPDAIKKTMRELFIASYAEFRQRLCRRLGSGHLADDALHETWLRIDSVSNDGVVRYPAAYLFRIALNVAEEQRRNQARIMSTDEIEVLYNFADELADPARITQGQIEVEMFHAILAELPPRRREMIIAARFDDLPHVDIARRFGVSLRTVEKELKAGLQYCCERMEKQYIQRLGPKTETLPKP
ncbi:RNA polymerase sigma factor [Serratia marcescens]|uniref:RNA polymerase sigma factor n=1 Tax=Serratia marcescens TaxID=615 RepID=UPI0013D9B763|nr:RNA polymerase sigma factor [Serratia marcescens]